MQPLNTTLYADWGRIIASAELIDDGVTYIQEAAVKSLSMAETQTNEEARRSIAAALQVRYRYQPKRYYIIFSILVRKCSL